MVAGSHHIDPEFKQIFGERRSNAESGCGVFAVCQNQVNEMLAYQAPKLFANNRPPGPPKNVAYEKNFHGDLMVSKWKELLGIFTRGLHCNSAVRKKS